MSVQTAEARYASTGRPILDTRDHHGMSRAAEAGAQGLRLAVSVERDADGRSLERTADDSPRTFVLPDSRQPLQEQPETLLAFRPFEAERAKPVRHGSNPSP